ncbi:MAG: CorA family divalent cation transporter, partial [Dermatophilaceae bacterium]
MALHQLAVEDAIHAHQRPKLDRYPDHASLSAYAVHFDPNTAQLTTNEFAAFITPSALVTVRKDDGIDIEAVMQRWDSGSDLAKHGVAFLLHGLLDYLVDTHFQSVQQLNEEIEKLEDLLFAANADQESVQRRSFELRKSL